MANPKTNEIKLLIQKFDDTEAILVSEKEEEIKIPARLIPKQLKAGDYVIASLMAEADKLGKEEKTAKDILNEIFKTI